MCTILEKNSKFYLSWSSSKFSFLKMKDPVSGSLCLKLNAELFIVDPVFEII